MKLTFDFSQTHKLFDAIAKRTANLCIPELRLLSQVDGTLYIIEIQIRAEQELPIIHILVTPDGKHEGPFEEVEIDINGNFQIEFIGNAHSTFSHNVYAATKVIIGNISLFTDGFTKASETIQAQNFLDTLYDVISDTNSLELDPDKKGYSILDHTKKMRLILEPDAMGYTPNAVEVMNREIESIPPGTLIH